MFDFRRVLKYLLNLLFIAFFIHLMTAAVFSDTGSVPRITAQELKAKIDKGEDILIIDVRTGFDYERSKIKIKDAVRISIVRIEEKAGELPRDKEIVTYCT